MQGGAPAMSRGGPCSSSSGTGARVTSQRVAPRGRPLLPLMAAAAAVADRVADKTPLLQEDLTGAGGRQRWRGRKARREQSEGQASSQDQQGGASYTGTTFSKSQSHSWVAQAVPSIVRCLTEQRARAAVDHTRSLAPMVEWVYSRSGGLEFEAQQLRPDQWDPKCWRDWACRNSKGAAGMVFVRLIAGPDECPMQPMEQTKHSSRSSSSWAPCHEHPTPTSPLVSPRAAVGGIYGQQEVPELEGHIDVDDCCNKAQAAKAQGADAQREGPSSSSAHATHNSTSAVEHHPPPYLSHIVPFHDPTVGSHSIGSSSHIPGTECEADAPPGGLGVSEPAGAAAAAAALGGAGLGLGLPGARSRRRFRARLRSNIDSSSAAQAARGTGGGCSGPAGAAGAQQQVAYYGLVAQSSGQGRGAAGHVPSSSLSHNSDGCYVLKMTQNMEAGGECTCTLFTLTRVCNTGPSLYQQLQESWLSLA